MDPNVRRDRPTPSWQRGYGDGLAMAFELVTVPLLFGLAGVGLDRWIGTSPAFTVAFVIVAVVGTAASTYYRYTARMDAEQEGKPWANRRR